MKKNEADTWSRGSFTMTTVSVPISKLILFSEDEMDLQFLISKKETGFRKIQMLVKRNVNYNYPYLYNKYHKKALEYYD